jgi:predicted nucleic acid-binding protein
VALLDPRDRLNAQSQSLTRSLAAEDAALCTSDAVLLEFANYFARSPLRAHCMKWIQSIRADPGWKVETIVPRVLAGAEARYRRHGDKNWSLTDCHSMEVMKARGIGEVCTSDDGFRQAGFRILP